MRNRFSVTFPVFAMCLALPSPAQTFETIYQFPTNTDAQTALLVGSKDQILGTTVSGGPANNGTIFVLNPPAEPAGVWTENTIYDFSGYPNCSLGCDPSGLTLGKGGVFYGTTVFGGAAGFGAVYQLSPPAGLVNSWTVKVIYSFSGPDGASPTGGVVLGPNGKLYGAARNGGALLSGTVFELTPPVSGSSWTETTLYTFQGGMTDGALPYSSPILGFDGNLYGGTFSGGPVNSGVLYKLTRPASGQGPWTEQILHAFNQLDGAGASGRLIFGRNGTLYGTTQQGGIAFGTAFALYPPSMQGGVWTLQTLHYFGGAAKDGLYPFAGLTFGRDGALYGTTMQTQGPGGPSVGVLYKLVLPSKPGNGATETVLYDFGQSPSGYPMAPLTLGPDGNLYGDTSQLNGTIFQFKP